MHHTPNKEIPFSNGAAPKYLRRIRGLLVWTKWHICNPCVSMVALLQGQISIFFKSIPKVVNRRTQTLLQGIERPYQNLHQRRPCPWRCATFWYCTYEHVGFQWWSFAQQGAPGPHRQWVSFLEFHTIPMNEYRDCFLFPIRRVHKARVVQKFFILFLKSAIPKTH